MCDGTLKHLKPRKHECDAFGIINIKMRCFWCFFCVRFVQTNNGLFIAETTTTDTDLYRCIASNPAGESERRVYLQVLGTLSMSLTLVKS